jgi:dTMP kinase
MSDAPTAEPARLPPARGAAYIAFEGWEASGKSTQAELLAQHLDGVLTREPGGSSLGQAIRGLLLGDGPVPTERAEALLFAADRAQHVAEKVRPNLEAGRYVVTDRSYGSTLAYQGYGRGQPLDELLRLSEWASDGLLPHLVVLVTLPVDEAERRLGSERDRLESEPAEFGERVRGGFDALAAADPHRWRVVDGSGSVDEVHERVVAVVARWLDDQYRGNQ